MVAITGLVLLREYDDGFGWPSQSRQKERAFRQGFVEEARRMVREWLDPDDSTFDPWGQEEAARLLRQRVRERYRAYRAAYGPGCAGRKTYHLGYLPGHEVPAARLRGRHHALAYITQAAEQVEDDDAFDKLIVPAWLTAVERWAAAPPSTRIIVPPPRPLTIAVPPKGSPGTAAPEPCGNPNNAAPKSFGLRVDAVCLADVQPEPVRWLWPGRFALGKLSLIAGEPGLGKSFLTLDMAARVSRGDGWPCDKGTTSTAGGVVLLSAEDDINDTIVPRLIEARADRSRIQAMRMLYQPMPGLGIGIEKPVPFSLLEHVPQLEELIRRAAPCRLVVVDPVSAFLGKTDSHNNSEVRGVLAPLSEMAARTGVAVVAVTHLNKGQGSALNRVIGSIAFTAAARAAYVITRDEDEPARRLMLPAKNNLGRDEDGFAYRLVGDPIAHIEWEPAPVVMSADEAVGARFRTRGPEPDARKDAEAWLLDYLSAGPRSASDVFDAARTDGHSKMTIKRAKTVLGVQSSKERFDGPWMWILPGGGPVMVGGNGATAQEVHEGAQRCLPPET